MEKGYGRVLVTGEKNRDREGKGRKGRVTKKDEGKGKMKKGCERIMER